MPYSKDPIVPAKRSREEHPGRTSKKPPELSPREREDVIEQEEEFEGPDRREKRGTPPSSPRTPGVAPS